MPVIGTAGHVDHGKSTLVQALTGRDPDRWEEEKRRGLTIDIGFAWTTLPGDLEVSFVDVPGHERFMKNMLAGIEAIDVALLVVAADEGWMPQSEEHLAVLHLLGVDQGVVALTKVDRVDPETAEIAALLVADRLAGTRLAGSSIVAVSALTGRGLDVLIDALTKLANAAVKPEGQRSRLWIDRSFVVNGAGTVVTGTLLDGPLHVDQQVQVWPGPVGARVRSLQSHELEVATAVPQRRTAVNLAGIERRQVTRGHMLGLPGQWLATDRFLVEHHTARYADPLTDRGAYHLHLGSGAWPVNLRVEDSELALLTLPEPVTVKVGDRFILREVGRRMVVAGGRVLDPSPPPTRAVWGLRRGLAALARDEAALRLLELRGRDSLTRLETQTGGGQPQRFIGASDTVWSQEAATTVVEGARSAVAEFHAANPLRAGIPLASLASRFELSQEEVTSLLATAPDLVIDQAVLRSARFTGALTDAEEGVWAAARAQLAAAGWTPPRLTELGVAGELVHALTRRGDLIKVAEDLAYLREQLDHLRGKLSELDQPFTVSAFKDALGITRKYAVPLLEWSDRQGWTVRQGDLRRVRN